MNLIFHLLKLTISFALNLLNRNERTGAQYSTENNNFARGEGGKVVESKSRNTHLSHFGFSLRESSHVH